jgi:serine/threonine protein kinase
MLKCLEADGAELQIAIKEFRRQESFDCEKRNLDQIQSIQHHHLIKHVATCKIGDNYFALFPWADGGNLLDFWACENLRQRTPELILWSLKQTLGLVDALKALHSKNFRHGDLKPQNILHFKKSGQICSGGRGILVIADVGVSRVHKEATIVRCDPTSTFATTKSYEGPEVQFSGKAPRSRKYDMWSIGCIFLEFTIWLLYDLKIVDSFEKLRESRDDPKTPIASFYDCAPEGTVKIHSVVSEAMDMIRKDPRCKGAALEDFVNLIAENLLLIEVQRRATAPDIYEKLKKIVHDAENDPSYLLPSVDLILEVPSMFRHEQNPTRPSNSVENTNGTVFSTQLDNRTWTST